MNRFITSIFLSARFLAAGACGFLCALALSPPLLAAAGHPAAAACVYFFFSPVCHQMPDRSFALLSLPLAVCHRCLGLYLGFFAGSFLRLARMHRTPRVRRRCVLAVALPLALDALLPCCGLWTNTPVSRFATGLLFGIPVASLLVRGIKDLLDEAPWQRLALGESTLKEASYE